MLQNLRLEGYSSEIKFVDICFSEETCVLEHGSNPFLVSCEDLSLILKNHYLCVLKKEVSFLFDVFEKRFQILNSFRLASSR